MLEREERRETFAVRYVCDMIQERERVCLRDREIYREREREREKEIDIDRERQTGRREEWGIRREGDGKRKMFANVYFAIYRYLGWKYEAE